MAPLGFTAFISADDIRSDWIPASFPVQDGEYGNIVDIVADFHLAESLNYNQKRREETMNLILVIWKYF
jgi:hypothetical protein